MTRKNSSAAPRRMTSNWVRSLGVRGFHGPSGILNIDKKKIQDFIFVTRAKIGVGARKLFSNFCKLNNVFVASEDKIEKLKKEWNIVFIFLEAALFPPILLDERRTRGKDEGGA